MFISVVINAAALSFICIVVLYINLMMPLEITGGENVHFEESNTIDLLILQTKVES